MLEEDLDERIERVFSIVCGRQMQVNNSCCRAAMFKVTRVELRS